MEHSATIDSSGHPVCTCGWDPDATKIVMQRMSPDHAVDTHIAVAKFLGF